MKDMWKTKANNVAVDGKRWRGTYESTKAL